MIVNPNLEPGNIRDPFIIPVDGVYYMTGSHAPFWDGPCPGLKLFRSADLEHWECLGWILRREDIAPDSWYIDRLWAPEILRRPEGFYLTVNGRNDDPRYRHEHATAIAFSPAIEGPYQVLTQKESILARIRYPGDVTTETAGNDASLYEDENGVFLFYCNYAGIWGVEIKLPECEPVGEAFLCVKPSPEGCWDTKNEGPFVVRRHGKYFLFYSSFTGPYSVGVVTADNVRGPWSPNPPQPLITPPAEGSITHSGHNAVFQGPGGRFYTCYHIQRREDPTEYLAIDPIEFHPDGRVETPAPTLGCFEP